MKIFNLTDVPTPALKNASLVNVSIKVGKYDIKPGQFVEMPFLPASAAKFRRIDAIFAGEKPPKKYTEAKEKLFPKDKKEEPKKAEAPKASATPQPTVEAPSADTKESSGHKHREDRKRER